VSAYDVVDATHAHALDLRDRLRALDLRECVGQGLSHRRVVHRTLRRSLFAKTAISDGSVIAMWGIGGPLIGDEGNPWFLTAPEVERFPVAIVREARYAVRDMLSLRSSLWNYVLADYAQAVKFLGILGFTVDPPAVIAGDTYRRFWKKV
jgi:hypothetical protein